jgi:soluble lytic murein transglycosylase
MLRHVVWCFPGLFAIALLTAVPLPADADGPAPDSVETASLTPDPDEAVSAAELPEILSEADVALYQRIFHVQEAGRWKEADRLIAKLEDRLLLGHAMAQRYLHPTKYRSRYKELKAWLAEYGDHPDARRLYKLALRRKPRNWRAPKAPTYGTVSANGHGTTIVKASPRAPRKRLSAANRRKANAHKRRVRWYLRKGWTKAAKQLIRAKEVRALLSNAEYDQLRARLGAGYFVDGRDEWALDWAGKAAKRSGRYVPEAHWTAGLAAWRLGRRALASRHFEAVAGRQDISPWMVSAAAFWAARSHLVGRRPEAFNRWLDVAAAHPRTFYGLLARRILGRPMPFSWDAPQLETEAIAALTEKAGGRRVIALMQVDQGRRAERDLRGLAGGAGPKLMRGILALASRANMPSLAMRLNGTLFPNGGGFDGAAYPVPRWVPKGGFRIDRALIFALIRQESGFNPKAKSWAGASGLMQLMPRTASFVARDRRLHSSHRRTLFEPEVNLSLGQKYIEILLADTKIKGDMFLLATAWNGGPGNLNKWRRRVKHMNDPLFFIECIPSRETRIFIERVFTNLWIYRDRLGQPMPSLDAIAAGDWPVYTALDQQTLMVADGVEN